MADLKLTKSEQQVLRELDGAPDKVLRYTSLASCAPYYGRLSPVGFRRVFDRLERRNMVGRDHEMVHLTFAGMQALNAAGRALFRVPPNRGPALRKPAPG